jgi:flagellar biosynthesis/type III secretory pathway protein FliH
MALALLKVSRDKTVVSTSRVLKAADVQALHSLSEAAIDAKSLVQEEREANETASQLALEIEKLRLAEEAKRETATALLAMAQKSAVFEQRVIDKFVPTLMQALRTMLGETLPAQFYEQALTHASQLANDADAVALHVSPYDADNALAAVEKFGIESPTPRVVLKKDATVRPGECCLQTPFGKLDLSLETQLTVLESSLDRWVQGKTTNDPN